jgi:DUF2892 family protein
VEKRIREDVMTSPLRGKTSDDDAGATATGPFGRRTDGETYPEGASVPIQAGAVNVGNLERVASAIGGGALALHGLRKASLAGGVMAALGAILVQRGVTGHCPLYEALGANTAR